MYNALKETCVCLCALMVWAHPARAQSYTCLPDTAERAVIEHDFVVDLVTGTDTATRNAYKLPSVSASKVSVVTTASVCRQAGAAYNATVANGRPPVSRTLVVIKVGTTRYVVFDPSEHAGEYHMQVVFDSHWSPLIWLGS